MRSRRRAVAGFVPFLMLIGLFAGSFAACTDDDQPNAMDRRFVAQAIAHHELGVELIELATTDAHDVRLRRLVFEQGTYHGHELQQLQSWAQEWGVLLPAASGFAGDVSDRLEELHNVVGPQFDAQWLEVMIEHHEGFVELCDALGVAGSHSELGEFGAAASDIQRDQLVEMRMLLMG